MSILSDIYIEDLLRRGLVDEPDYNLVNPASLDIRIGWRVRMENSLGQWEEVQLPKEGLPVRPGKFLLVDTLETFRVPNGYAMDLRLKSSTARRGWDHALAVWVDPGWEGVLTMELRNALEFGHLQLIPGMRFAQAVIHKLHGPSARPYAGRYQGAKSVEGAKD